MWYWTPSPSQASNDRPCPAVGDRPFVPKPETWWVTLACPSKSARIRASKTGSKREPDLVWRRATLAWPCSSKRGWTILGGTRESRIRRCPLQGRELWTLEPQVGIHVHWGGSYPQILTLSSRQLHWNHQAAKPAVNPHGKVQPSGHKHLDASEVPLQLSLKKKTRLPKPALNFLLDASPEENHAKDDAKALCSFGLLYAISDGQLRNSPMDCQQEGLAKATDMRLRVKK